MQDPLLCRRLLLLFLSYLYLKDVNGVKCKGLFVSNDMGLLVLHFYAVSGLVYVFILVG